jgi:hypothetical protein
MGRPRKWRGVQAKRKGDAVGPPDVEAPAYHEQNFPTNLNIGQIGQLFDVGVSAEAPNCEKSGGVDSLGEKDLALQHFGAVNLNMPVDLGAGNSLSIAKEHIALYNNVQVAPTLLSTPAAPCSCLAAMYLAMAPLQQLSSRLGTALAAVRTAVNTARLILRCEHCGHCMADPMKPTIEAFQNMMLLGTLLPIIVDIYKRLSEMVDHEAGMAKAAGYQMSLDILQDNTVCGASLENALMQPEEWAAAVHYIIRDDIYGHEMMSSGLKGIISEMEERQRRGHTKIDVLSNHGLFNICQQRQCPGERNAPCLQILSITKIAMEALAIA